MKNRSKTNIFLLIAFVLAIILSLADLSQAQRTKIVGNTYIEAASIDSPLFSATLKSILAFKGSNGRVTAADTAYALGVATLSNSNQISATFKDSLFNFLIDTADYARYLAKGAITDTTQFSDGLKNILQNTFINKANDANTSDYSDSSGKSGYATVAGAALTAPTQQHCSTATYATSAGSATYATTAGSLGSSDSSVTYNSLSPAVRDSINYAADSAYYAKNIVDGSVDALAKFSTGVQTTYLPTANEKIAMGMSNMSLKAPSGTNHFMDSSATFKHFVNTGNDTINRLSLQMTGGTHIAGYGVSIDTVRKILFVGRGIAGSDSFILDDSASTYAAINSVTSATASNYYDFNAGGSATHTIYVQGAAPILGGVPVGASEGDLCFDSTDQDETGAPYDSCNLWLYASSKWRPIKNGGTGGGSSSPLSVTYDLYSPTGSIDVDSLLRTYRNAQVVVADSFLMPHKLAVDSILPNNGVGGYNTVGVIGTPTRSFYEINGNILRGTEIGALGGTGVLSLGSGTTNFQPTDLTSQLGSSTKIWDSIYVKGPVISGATRFSGNIVPTANKTYDIGAPALMIDSAFIYDGVFANGSTYIKSTGDVLMSNGNLTMSNGNIIQTGSHTASGNITTTGGDLITSKKYFLYNTNPRYGVTGQQDSMLDNATSCIPYLPTAKDQFLTRSWGLGMQSTKIKFTNAKFYSNWFNIWNGILQNTPSCRDSNDYSERRDTTINYPRNPMEITWVNNLTTDTLDDPIPRNGDPNQWRIRSGRTPVIVDCLAVISGGSPYVAEYQNPMMSGQIFVQSNGNDSTGPNTGYYRTPQPALDSLISVRVQVSSSATSGGYGQYTFYGGTTTSAGQRPQLKRGLRTLDTLNGNFGNILSYIKSVGAWACIDSIKTSPTTIPNSRKKLWFSIDSWVNDSTFTFADTQAYYASVSSGELWITISRPTTITILPPKDGATIVLTTPMRVHNFCPLTIKGLGENQTVITNMANGYFGTAPSFSSIIISGDNNGSGAWAFRDTTMGCMPLAIEGMTILARAGSSAADSGRSLCLSGRVRIKDVSIISNAGTTNIGDSCVIYFSETQKKAGADTCFNWPIVNSSLYLENVSMAADSNKVLVKTNSKLSFDARNCVFGISGTKGRIIKATRNMSSTGSVKKPKFTQCEFYTIASDAPTYWLQSTVTQTSAAPEFWMNHFIGAAYPTNVDGTNWTTTFGGASYNFYDASDTEPPAKLSDSQKLFQSKGISPK